MVMDGHEYRLKEQTSNNISSIASHIDALRSDLNHNAEVNSKRIDNVQSAIHWLRKKQRSNEWSINYWESVVNSLTRAMTRTNA